MSHEARSARDKEIANLHIKVSRPPVREVATSGQGEQKIESERGTLTITAAHAARQGVRDCMEDAHVFEENFSESRSQCTSGSHSLFGVFDGHGGATAADYCARTFPEILKKYLRRCEHVHIALKQAIEECDEEVVAYATDGSGSTGSICLIDCVTHDLYCANVGDSRCILVSKADGERIPLEEQETDSLFVDNPNPFSDIGVRQLSIEHKPKDQKEKDRITQCGGFVVGGRVMGVLGVSRAFGDRDFKQLNNQLIVSWPDITHHKLSPRDEFVVVACDGLYDVMTNDEVGTYVREKALIASCSIERLARSMVDEAIRNRRAHDNVSTIVIKIDIEDPIPSSPDHRTLTSIATNVDPDDASHRRVGHAEHAEVVQYVAQNIPSVESTTDVRVDQIDPNALNKLASEYPRDSIASAMSGLSANSQTISVGLVPGSEGREISISESGDAIIEDVTYQRRDDEDGMDVDPENPNVQRAVV